jgi:uncharacterized protein (TIGR03437 family)
MVSQSTPVGLTVTDAVPAIFTSDASGMGHAAALNQDNTINGTSNPAAGYVVALYGTGGGGLTTDPLPRLVLPVSASVGGLTAEIFYAGIAPGLVQGAMQVNVQIPSGVTPGPTVPNHHHGWQCDDQHCDARDSVDGLAAVSAGLRPEANAEI